MSPLLSPLRFLAIRHGHYVAYNVVLPGLLGSAATALIMLWPEFGSLTGSDGLLASLQNPLAIVGGFFVAALTLIVSDGNVRLKAMMGGSKPPTLDGQPLNRRRFLAYLFGYLAFSSFALVGMGLVGELMAAGARVLFPENTLIFVKIVCIAFYSFWLAHLIVSTLLGLYYFTERLHQSDREMKKGSAAAEAGGAKV